MVADFLAANPLVRVDFVLSDAKADLIARAVATAPTQSPAQTAELAALVSRYYRHVAPEDLVGRDPVDGQTGGVIGGIHTVLGENREGESLSHEAYFRPSPPCSIRRHGTAL